VPATVVDAVQTPIPCACRCHELLTVEERMAGIEALYRFDDAMRGWGQTVLWDLAAPMLWRIQQRLGGVGWVAVLDGGAAATRRELVLARARRVAPFDLIWGLEP